MKKYLLFGMLTAVLAGALVLAGCVQPTNGTDGGPGNNGAGGPASPVFLSGSLSTEAIQQAIDFTYRRPASALGGAIAEDGFGDNVYAPLYFAGVVQDDPGVIVVPANRKIKLSGANAITIFNDGTDGGTIVVADESGIDTSTTGKITGTGGTADSYAIVPNALSGFVDTANITKIEIKDSAGDLPAPGPVAILGPVTVTDGATGGKNFKNDGLGGKDIYIIGSDKTQVAFTVSNAIVAGNAASVV